MKSLATLVNLYASLSQNTSATNMSLGLQLLGDQQRYTVQKYFDNERSFQTTTIGGSSYTTTVTLSLGATSATLTAAWSLPTCQQLTNFSNGNQRLVLFTNGSTAISWVGALTTSATTALTTVGVQRYLIPASISKITNDSISVGQLRYVPAPIMTRNDWDRLNTLPYTSDIVNYYYIYNGAVEFYPIPSTTGNIIQFNYKARVPDLSFLYGDASGAVWTPGSTAYDYQKGTVTPPAVGAIAVTGASTAWNTTGGFPLNTDVSIFNLFLVINPGKGDGIWYPISQFTSDTALVLQTPAVNQPTSAAGATYSIAQLPILQEDFHDMLVMGALRIYFSSIKTNEKNQYVFFDAQYKERLELLEAYAGTKQVNVDLGPGPSMLNPNLFLFGNN